MARSWSAFAGTAGDESEKGRWFENLVRRVLLENPEYEVAEVHRWADWPERMPVTGLGGNDIGIDLVARHGDGNWMAIQCKCYSPTVRVGKGHIDSFLASSQIGGTVGGPVFAMRWIVATCPWTKTAEVQIEALVPPVRRIDFLRHGDDAIAEEAAQRPVRSPWPLQAEAIEDVVDGLGNHDRGRLIMACGTGKTFTALRIAERTVADGGRILFVAPSIALVSQARREWLRHTTRKLDSRVVCSDYTAGGRGESRNDIGLSELECAVTSDARALADMLANPVVKRTRVIFSTYQSLRHVAEAQSEYGAPPFDLALMDEAHRTTGVTTVNSKDGEQSGFRAIHDEQALKAFKRLYMTATPRIYTASSRTRLKTKGIETVDMGDLDVYGPELHSLTFSKAVNAGMLSDYRVIVLGIHEDRAPPGVTGQLISLGEDRKLARGKPLVVTSQDVIRLLGTSLAINGATEGSEEEGPGRLHRTIAFSNSIARSSFYARRDETAGAPQDHHAPTSAERCRSGGVPARRSATPGRVGQRAQAESGAARSGQSRRPGGRAGSVQRRPFQRRRGCSVVRRHRVHGAASEPGGHRPGGGPGDAKEPRQAPRVHRGAHPHRTGRGLGVGTGGGHGRLSRGGEGAARASVARWTTGRGPGAVRAGLRVSGCALGSSRPTAGRSSRSAGTCTGRCEPGRLRPRRSGLRPWQARPPGLAGTSSTRCARRHGCSSKGSWPEMSPPRSDCPPRLATRTSAPSPRCSWQTPVCSTDDSARCPDMEGIAKLNQVGGADDPAAVLKDAWDAILKRDYAPVFEPPLAVLDVLPERRWAGQRAAYPRRVRQSSGRLAERAGV